MKYVLSRNIALYFTPPDPVNQLVHNRIYMPESMDGSYFPGRGYGTGRSTYGVVETTKKHGPTDPRLSQVPVPDAGNALRAQQPEQALPVGVRKGQADGRDRRGPEGTANLWMRGRHPALWAAGVDSPTRQDQQKST